MPVPSLQALAVADDDPDRRIAPFRLRAAIGEHHAIRSRVDLAAADRVVVRDVDPRMERLVDRWPELLGDHEIPDQRPLESAVIGEIELLRLFLQAGY